MFPRVQAAFFVVKINSEILKMFLNGAFPTASVSLVQESVLLRGFERERFLLSDSP